MNKNKIEELPDELLNEYATRFIMLECWHDVEPNPREKLYGRCVLCKNMFPANKDYCQQMRGAIKLVHRLKQRIIDANSVNFDYPFNYAAFSTHIKSKTLSYKPPSNPDTLYHEEIFLLYLIKPRQIVEACLLAVDYEKLISA